MKVEDIIYRIRDKMIKSVENPETHFDFLLGFSILLSLPYIKFFLGDNKCQK